MKPIADKKRVWVDAEKVLPQIDTPAILTIANVKPAPAGSRLTDTVIDISIIEAAGEATSSAYLVEDINLISTSEKKKAVRVEFQQEGAEFTKQDLLEIEAGIADRSDKEVVALQAVINKVSSFGMTTFKADPNLVTTTSGVNFSTATGTQLKNDLVAKLYAFEDTTGVIADRMVFDQKLRVYLANATDTVGNPIDFEKVLGIPLYFVKGLTDANAKPAYTILDNRNGSNIVMYQYEEPGYIETRVKDNGGEIEEFRGKHSAAFIKRMGTATLVEGCL